LAKTALSVDAAVLTSRITRTPFPGSRKIYIEGTRPDICVPFRDVTLTDTLVAEGSSSEQTTRREANPPLRLFDSSGVYTDPAAAIDITRGLAPLRGAWINERGDTEALPGISSAYGRERLNDPLLCAAESRDDHAGYLTGRDCHQADQQRFCGKGRGVPSGWPRDLFVK
jgi:phosphomethylpyrimidine synthase